MSLFEILWVIIVGTGTLSMAGYLIWVVVYCNRQIALRDILPLHYRIEKVSGKWHIARIFPWYVLPRKRYIEGMWALDSDGIQNSSATHGPIDFGSDENALKAIQAFREEDLYLSMRASVNV